MSGGTTLDFESLDIDSVKAQYVRIVSNGNESNDWNSIVEVAVFGCGEQVKKPETPILTERQGRSLCSGDKSIETRAADGYPNIG